MIPHNLAALHGTSAAKSMDGTNPNCKTYTCTSICSLCSFKHMIAINVVLDSFRCKQEVVSLFVVNLF